MEKAHWRAEILLQIYYDQCGLKILSRHDLIGTTKSELGIPTSF